MDSLKRLSLIALLSAAAGGALAAVFEPSIAMSGGGMAVLMTSFNAGSGTAGAAGITHTYTVGAASTVMGGNGYTLSPGPMNSVHEARLNLDDAHAFPNPYKPSAGHTKITFTGLTADCIINIYTLSGQKIASLAKNDNTDTLVWPTVVNDRGGRIASGVYLYGINSAGIRTKRGKLMIIK